MAKRTKKSKATSQSKSGKKAAKRAQVIIFEASRPLGDDEDVDGCDCVCHENEAISDSDLPAATGGIEVKPKSKTRRAAA